MPVLVSSLLVAALAAGVVEAAVGADGEVAAGRAPVDITGPEEDSVTFTLIPGAGLRLHSPATRLALSYTPRIFYRVPNALNIDRPLVLHQLSLAHDTELSRRASWLNSAQFSLGELDYTASGVVFDRRVTSVVRTSVAEVLRAEGQTGVTLDLSRRLVLNLDLSGEYTTPTEETRVSPAGAEGMPPPEGAPDLPTFDPVPESAQAAAEASLGYRLSRYDQVAVTGGVTYQWFPDTGRYLLVSPDVSWESQLNQRTAFEVSAGLAYVITLEAAQGTDDSNAIGGTGSLRIGSIVHRSRDMTVGTSFSASLDWFFDPIAGTSQPRAGVDAAASIEIGRDWQIGPNASFYTVLRDAGTGVGGGGATGEGDPAFDLFLADATVLRGEVPVSYAISRPVNLNFGVRAALRGRELSHENFRLGEQYEVWAFLGLTVRFATSASDDSWLPL